jgi:hypothetical protein
MHLAFDDHGIDDGAEVVDGDPIDDVGDAGVGIDLDFGNVRAGREGEVGGIVEGVFLQALCAT